MRTISNKNYTIYHLHSDLSNGVTNIDSVTKYYEYIETAKKCGMKAMGFAEHGSILEWVHKKKQNRRKRNEIYSCRRILCN